MQIADEVDHVTQCVRSCPSTRFRIAENRKLVGDRFRDATSGLRAILSEVLSRKLNGGAEQTLVHALTFHNNR